jgi:hypothetical protein
MGASLFRKGETEQQLGRGRVGEVEKKWNIRFRKKKSLLLKHYCYIILPLYRQ